MSESLIDRRFSVSIGVFQTFVDMEGSGFPDLESVRVRRTTRGMWRRIFLVSLCSWY